MRFSFSLVENFREEKGVSLIEVMISVAILAAGILAVAKMQIATTKNTTNGNVLTMATMLAHSHLEQVKNVPDISDLDDAAHPLVVTQRFDTEGNADGEGLYQISMVVNPAGGAGIGTLARDVEVTVSWSRVWGVNKQVTLRTVTQGNGV